MFVLSNEKLKVRVGWRGVNGVRRGWVCKITRIIDARLC